MCVSLIDFAGSCVFDLRGYERTVFVAERSVSCGSDRCVYAVRTEHDRISEFDRRGLQTGGESGASFAHPLLGDDPTLGVDFVLKEVSDG